MTEAYNTLKQKLRDEQKAANLRNREEDFDRIIKLFAARHKLAVTYASAVPGFDLETELHEIGTKIVEWFGLQYDTRSQIDEDGFAPPLNLEFPWAVSAFWLNKLPFVTSAKITDKAKLARDKISRLATIDDEDEEYKPYDTDMGGIVSKDNMKEATAFLKSIENYLLIPDDEPDEPGMVYSKYGVTRAEKEIISDYLQIFISSKWQDNMEQSLKVYTAARLLEKKIFADVITPTDEMRLEIEAQAERMHANPMESMTNVLKNTGVATMEEYDEARKEAETEILEMIRVRSRELSDSMVDKMLDQGRQSITTLNEFNKQQQIGWGEIHVAGKNAIKLQLCMTALDTSAAFLAYDPSIYSGPREFVRYKDEENRLVYGDVDEIPDFIQKVRDREQCDIEWKLGWTGWYPTGPPETEEEIELGERKLALGMEKEWWSDKEVALTTWGQVYNIMKLFWGLLGSLFLVERILFPSGIPSGGGNYIKWMFIGLRACAIGSIVIGMATMYTDAGGTIPDVNVDEIEAPTGGGYVTAIAVWAMGAAMASIQQVSDMIVNTDLGQNLTIVSATTAAASRLYLVGMDFGGSRGKLGFRDAYKSASRDLGNNLGRFTTPSIESMKDTIDSNFGGGSGGQLKEVEAKLVGIRETIDGYVKVKDDDHKRLIAAGVLTDMRLKERMALAQEEANANRVLQLEQAARLADREFEQRIAQDDRLADRDLEQRIAQDERMALAQEANVFGDEGGLEFPELPGGGRINEEELQNRLDALADIPLRDERVAERLAIEVPDRNGNAPILSSRRVQPREVANSISAYTEELQLEQLSSLKEFLAVKRDVRRSLDRKEAKALKDDFREESMTKIIESETTKRIMKRDPKSIRRDLRVIWLMSGIPVGDDIKKELGV